VEPTQTTQSPAFDAALQAFRSQSGIEERQRLVIRDAARWREVWAAIVRNISPAPAAPDVDFSRQMIVLAAMGSRPTGGASITIVGVERAGGRLRVTVRETSPGRGCMTTQAFTAPLAAALVPRSDEPVDFVERSEVREC
jgi:hypothetical protein